MIQLKWLKDAFKIKSTFHPAVKYEAIKDILKTSCHYKKLELEDSMVYKALHEISIIEKAGATNDEILDVIERIIKEKMSEHDLRKT